MPNDLSSAYEEDIEYLQSVLQEDQRGNRPRSDFAEMAREELRHVEEALHLWRNISSSRLALRMMNKELQMYDEQVDPVLDAKTDHAIKAVARMIKARELQRRELGHSK